MDLQLNSISPGSICEGCLSVERKLTPVFDRDSLKIFGDILDPVDHVYHPLFLCWECAAATRRVLRFGRQVRRAHDGLVKYMLQQTPHLISLSNLMKTAGVCQEITFVHSETLKIETCNNSMSVSDISTPIVGESINNNDDVDNISSLVIKNTSKETIDTSRRKRTLRNAKCKDGTSLTNVETLVNTGKRETLQDESRPLFIKVEDESDKFVELDWFCEDNQNADHEDVKDVSCIKSDPFQYEVSAPSKMKSKLKKTRRKAKAEEFNESDDEPLTLMKKGLDEEGCKPRGRRKADEGKGPKIDRRKNPAPKREKPAGVVTNPRVSRQLQRLSVEKGQLEMVVLSWAEVEEERQRALQSDAFTRHEYRCHDCVLGFNHKFKLENHMKKHDQTAGGAQCAVCRVRCRDAHALCAHKRRHRVRWRCCACNATWSRAAVAADHAARAHGAAAPRHVCSVCGRVEPTLGKLRNHLKNHAERQKCELCGKTFRDRTSLRTHLFIHSGEKEYACPRCDKRFLFKKAMEVHLITHEESEHLYCYECDVNFKNRMSYYQHMKYNLKHIDPAKLKHACALCDKRFVKATRLREHNLAVHLKETPIRCGAPGCQFACSSRPVLRTHTRMVHRHMRARRNHVCDTCGKAYTTKKTLEGHMRSHTGERPFGCAHCPSTFGYEAALYNHNKLVHLREKTGRGRPAQAPPPAPPAWPLPLPLTAPLPLPLTAPLPLSLPPPQHTHIS